MVMILSPLVIKYIYIRNRNESSCIFLICRTYYLCACIFLGIFSYLLICSWTYAPFCCNISVYAFCLLICSSCDTEQFNLEFLRILCLLFLTVKARVDFFTCFVCMSYFPHVSMSYSYVSKSTLSFLVERVMTCLNWNCFVDFSKRLKLIIPTPSSIIDPSPDGLVSPTPWCNIPNHSWCNSNIHFIIIILLNLSCWRLCALLHELQVGWICLVWSWISLYRFSTM